MTVARSACDDRAMDHWVANAPSWLSALTGDETSRGETLTVAWLSQAASLATKREADAAAEDAQWGDRPIGTAIAQRRARSVIVGRGPERTARLQTRSEAIWLWFDPETPDQLFAAFGLGFPSVLWLPVGDSLATIERALQPYLVNQAPGVLATAGRERYFIAGDENAFENVAGFYEQRQLTFDTTTPWGSKYAEDPWGEERPIGASLSIRESYAYRDFVAQNGSSVDTLSFRTLFSRTVARIERHPFSSVVVEVQYTPHPDSAIVAAINRDFDVALPVDAPLDLAVSLLYAGKYTRSRAAEIVAADGPSPMAVLAQCALMPAHTTTQAKLLEWAKDPALFRDVLDIATAFGFRQLALVLAATTANPEEAELIYGWMARAAEPPAETEGDSDDDDDDYDYDDYEDEED